MVLLGSCDFGYGVLCNNYWDVSGGYFLASWYSANSISWVSLSGGALLTFLAFFGSFKILYLNLLCSTLLAFKATERIKGSFILSDSRMALIIILVPLISAEEFENRDSTIYFTILPGD